MRRGRWMFALACVPALTAYGEPVSSVDDLARAYWEARMERYPTSATALGDHRYDDQLTDLSEAGRRKWKVTLNGFIDVARRLPVRQLSEAQRLTHDLLVRELRDELLRIECMAHLMPLDPLRGPHVRLPLILVSQPFENAKDYRAYVRRLVAFSDQVTGMIGSMREGIVRGWVSPRLIVEKVIPQIKAHLVADVTTSEFYRPARTADALGEADRKNVLAELVDTIEGDVIPAYLRLLAFVEDEYLPQTRSTVGIGALPNGDRVYAALTRLHTTTRIKPAAIHEIGLAEVTRISGEMTKVAVELGFTGSLEEFLEQTGKDAANRFTSSQELFDAAGAILDRTKPLMSQLFGRLPKADCVMKEVESYRAASSPMAYYGASPEDGSRPGYYYINTYRPEDRLRYTLEALTYHEAVPGHHFQMALDQENKSLPKFRRYASFTAYVEGWALYSEKLGYEIGGYRDPLSRLGQLTFEMWRACRLVVDTGLHIKSWTRQRAIDYMILHTGMTQVDIEAEVDRYITWPGQALAYKIGELRIVKLRRKAEAQLGDRFDLRSFHDALLAGGAMPLDMLEKRMDSWLAAQAP